MTDACSCASRSVRLDLYESAKIWLRHDTVIPRLIYPAPLEPGSQAAVGLTSTAMGDLAGISGAVSFLFAKISKQTCHKARTRSALHAPSGKALQRALVLSCRQAMILQATLRTA